MFKMPDCKFIVMMFALMITMLVGATEGKYIEHRHKNILEMSLEGNSENNDGLFVRKYHRGHHQKTRIHDDITTEGNYFQTWKVLQNDLEESSSHMKSQHHSNRRIKRPVAHSKKIRISNRFGDNGNEDDDELRPIWGTSNTATTPNILSSSPKRRLARRKPRILSTTTLKPSDISFLSEDTEESRPIWGFDKAVVPTRRPQIHSTTIHVKPDANIFHFKHDDESLPVWGWGGAEDVETGIDTIRVIPTRLPRPKFTTMLPPLVH